MGVWLLPNKFIIIIIILYESLVLGLFFLVLLLNQRWSPLLTLQASHCSIFRIMCDVPSIAVSYSESIECLPGTASKFFQDLLVTIPVAPVITGIIVHFRFHIPVISIHKLLLKEAITLWMYKYLLYFTVVTQHVKTVSLLRLVIFG